MASATDAPALLGPSFYPCRLAKLGRSCRSCRLQGMRSGRRSVQPGIIEAMLDLLTLAQTAAPPVSLAALSVPAVAILLAIGLVAGTLGGLAGVGGSMIILPALGLIFGYSNWAAIGDGSQAGPGGGGTQHLYQAVAMMVNVVVAIPAALRHRKAKLSDGSPAINARALPTLTIVTALCVIAGVLLSNLFKGLGLVILLASFQIAYSIWTARQLLTSAPDFEPAGVITTTGRLATSAGPTGFVAGLLGLGGGVLQVPLLQWVCRFPLRSAVATSSAVMSLTAIIGAAAKMVSLPSLGQSVLIAFLLALCMTPTAVIGANLGARLAHRLPLKAVRWAILALLVVAAVSMVLRAVTA